MLTRTRLWFADQHGATAIEYGLIVCLLSLTIVSFVTSVHQKIYVVFMQLSSAIASSGQ
ncbi:MAG: Flp family type IVb pilin [Caulobacteraceae bacterium]|nr:Flp family type IVb pilin [Caulobacter sp.]